MEVKQLLAELGFQDITAFGDMRCGDVFLNRREFKSGHDVLMFLINWGRNDGQKTLQKNLQDCLGL